VRPAEHDSGNRLVLVWDLPTRAFHWLLVAAVVVGCLTGFVAPEWWMGEHVAAGYVVVALLVFRLVWGFFGPEYSRLASLARTSRQFVQHVRGLLLLRPPHHIGHNPAGAVMIFALFVVLTALVATGLMIQGGEEKQGALAGITTYAVGNGAKRIHEALVFLLLAMVALHVTGVLAESWLLKAPLIRAMITGWLPMPRELPTPRPHPARPFAAAVGLVAIIGAAAIALVSLSRLAPLGIPTMPVNQAFAEECGACHYAFHPSLRPRASWAALLDGLADHFGEDASLSAPNLAEIAAYLDLYAAESWDTEAAQRFSVLSEKEPLRITATPYWQIKHAHISAATFDAPGIKGKTNCIACHRDADTGRFDDQAINIPANQATGGTE